MKLRINTRRVNVTRLKSSIFKYCFRHLKSRKYNQYKSLCTIIIHIFHDLRAERYYHLVVNIWYTSGITVAVRQ